MMRILSSVLVLLLIWASDGLAQSPVRITGALVDVGNPALVSISFSDDLSPGGPQENVNQVHLTGAPTVVVRAIGASLLQANILTVTLSGPLPPGEVKICFDRVAYVRANKTLTTSELCAPVSADVDTAKNAALKVLTDTPVPPDEKTLNASGFVTTASESTEGGADLSFNPKLSDPNATAFVRLKKTTAEKGDAKHFEIGMAYRVGVPWNRGQLRQMREAADLTAIGQLLRDRQRSLIAGSVVNFAAKLEGEPTSFGATNGVGEAEYQIHTMTRGLWRDQGFWRAYLIPVGAEVGRKLGVDETGSPTSDHEWIARYKAGGGLKLYYQAADRIVIPRVDVDVHGIWRYLGVDELNYNTGTKQLDRTISGGRGYLQLDLKVFLGQTASGLFGVKASYNRGSLPPVYAPVKSFEFGFVIESK